MICRKILIVTICLTFALGVSSRADLFINWFAEFGFVPNRATTGGVLDENVGILNVAVNPSQEAVGQLVFTPDATVGDALAGGAASGNDMVLGSFVFSGLGGGDHPVDPNWGAFTTAISYQGPYLGDGFVFARTFETTQPSIAPGTWYFDGPLLATVDLDPGPPLPVSQSYQQNLNTLPGGFGDELNKVVVPEPSTLVLAGLGLLVMARRRRRAS